MAFPKSWRNVEIEQQIIFGFSVEKIKMLLDGWDCVKDYAFIVHDKDFKEDGTPKEPHIHLMIRFHYPVSTVNILARAKKIFENETTVTISQLEKIKKWNSAVAYLTHENVTGKHIYNRDEIISNFDFATDIDNALSDKIKREKLITDIANGTIKLFDIHNHCTPIEFDKWKRSIDNAFIYRQKILLESGDRNMKCIYIQGDSGVGKTSMAKEICNNKQFSYFISSGSNDPLDGYAGQDAIILDEIRPSTMKLADLLKMLDPNTASSVPSRYSNKVLECRLIILTTVLDINTFFSQVFKEQEETAKQLRRRCEQLYKMTKTDMTIGLFIQETGNYMFMPPVPNPIATKYGLTEEQSIQIMTNSVRDMLRGIIPDSELDNAVQKMLDKAKQDKENDGFMSVSDTDTLPFN